MTPKEKSIELVNKFLRYVPAEEEYEFPYAKQCALIAVDEIISEIEPSVTMDVIEARIKYWEEVKELLEKQSNKHHIVDTNEMVEKSGKPINLTSSQTEISDEEIEKAMLDRSDLWNDPLCFEIGWKDAIKWYREQLKQTL